MSFKRAAAALAFALILVGGFQTYYLRIFTQDRDALLGTLTELPWRKLPGFRRLMLEAAKVTNQGDSIALWIEPMRWMEGYEYGYVRAGYLLGGREVLPLINPDGAFLVRNALRADVIACYRCQRVPRGFQIIRRTEDGLILRRPWKR